MKVDYKLFNRSGVYKITNKINGKFYIGSSCNLYNRIYEHFRYLKLNRHSNPKLQAAYNKYGIGNFEWSIITFGNCDYCFKIEQLCFDIYKPEYNIYLKAEMTNRSLSEETKKKIGFKSKQKFINNPKLKEDFINRQKGKIPWNKGKTNIYTKEVIKKMSDGGKIRGVAHLHTKEAHEKRNKSNFKRPVDVYDLNMNKLHSFISMTEAVKVLNLPKHAIGSIRSGLNENKKRYGFYWKDSIKI